MYFVLLVTMTRNPSHPCPSSPFPRRPHRHWRPPVVLPSHHPHRTKSIGRSANDSVASGTTSLSNRCSPSISFPACYLVWPHRTWIWRRLAVWILPIRPTFAMRWRCVKRQTIHCMYISNKYLRQNLIKFTTTHKIYKQRRENGSTAGCWHGWMENVAAERTAMSVDPVLGFVEWSVRNAGYSIKNHTNSKINTLLSLSIFMY